MDGVAPWLTDEHRKKLRKGEMPKEKARENELVEAIDEIMNVLEYGGKP